MHYRILVTFLFSASFLFLLTCKKQKLEPDHQSTIKIETDSISFAVIGDFGKEGDNTFLVSELVKSWNPDFIITTGDNNYNYGEWSTFDENLSQYYCDYIYNPDAPEAYRCAGAAAEKRQNRFFPTLGNHDQKGDLEAEPYLGFFTLPDKEIYYDFQWGPVHFFTVNSGKTSDTECCDTEQAKWLQEKLAASTQYFKIVYFHHAPYSSSKHGSSEDMQWPFEDWGANAVITGHNHVYEHIVKKDNPLVYYFVNGLGGKSRHDCDVNPLDTEVYEDFCFDEDYGAMLVTATKDKIMFQFFTISSPTIPIHEVELFRIG